MSHKKRVNFSGLTRHHSLPSSRCPFNTDKTIVYLPSKFHQAFHYLFGNLTIEETHEFLDIVLVAGKVWTQRQLSDLIEQLKEESCEVRNYRE